MLFLYLMLILEPFEGKIITFMKDWAKVIFKKSEKILPVICQQTFWKNTRSCKYPLLYISLYLDKVQSWRKIVCRELTVR